MNSQALEYYQVLRSHTKQDQKNIVSHSVQARISQVMERSEAPFHLRSLNVFFRTTSLTPSRPDIAKTRPRLSEGRWAIYHVLLTTATTSAATAAGNFQPVS